MKQPRMRQIEEAAEIIAANCCNVTQVKDDGEYITSLFVVTRDTVGRVNFPIGTKIYTVHDANWNNHYEYIGTREAKNAGAI